MFGVFFSIKKEKKKERKIINKKMTTCKKEGIS